MAASAASAGDWRGVLAAAPAPAASPARGAAASPPVDAVAAAWRVAALIKTRHHGAASDELARLGDLDAVPDCPYALRWAAAELPARAGADGDAGAAFSSLLAFCERRREGAPSSTASTLWSNRAQACEWALARLAVKRGDPSAARAWARAALERRAGPWPDPDTPPSGLDAAALSATARLELALGDVAAAKKLFAAAAAAPDTTSSPADAARASALLRLAAGDAARAADGFAGAADAAGGGDAAAVDATNEALCRLHAGDVDGAAAAAARPLLARPLPTNGLTPGGLRLAGLIADLAAPPVARATRARWAAAAAGAPDELGVGGVVGGA